MTSEADLKPGEDAVVVETLDGGGIDNKSEKGEGSHEIRVEGKNENQAQTVEMVERRIAEMEIEKYDGENGRKWLAQRVKEEFSGVKEKMNSVEDKSEREEFLVKVIGDLVRDKFKTELKLKRKEGDYHKVKWAKEAGDLKVTKLEQQVSVLENLSRTLRQQRDAQEEKTQNIAASFRSSVSEIDKKIEDGERKHKEAHERNIELRETMENFVKQNEIMTEKNAKILEAKDLELQLAEARVKEQEVRCEQEGLKTKAYQEKCVELAKQNEALQQQLANYSSKYDEFGETVQKSFDIIKENKKEMTGLVSQVKSLTHENLQLNGKLNKQAKLNIALSSESKDSQATIKSLKAKISVLEKLSRDLKQQLDAQKVL